MEGLWREKKESRRLLWPGGAAWLRCHVASGRCDSTSVVPLLLMLLLLRQRLLSCLRSLSAAISVCCICTCPDIHPTFPIQHKHPGTIIQSFIHTNKQSSVQQHSLSLSLSWFVINEPDMGQYVNLFIQRRRLSRSRSTRPRPRRSRRGRRRSISSPLLIVRVSSCAR